MTVVARNTENNRSYGIRERIKIQVWKRFRITPRKCITIVLGQERAPPRGGYMFP